MKIKQNKIKYPRIPPQPKLVFASLLKQAADTIKMIIT